MSWKVPGVSTRRRLVLINPVSASRAGLGVNRGFRFPPLSLGILAALTPDGWDVELIDENWQPCDYRPADLVGITAFTSVVNRAYEVATGYRERGVPVVMGGIHASMCPDEARQFVDAVVVGEAETVWAEVLADAEAKRLAPVYRGTLAELSGTPRPRRDLFHPGNRLASVQTSRGCPMDCEFCSVPAFNGRCYRRRPPEEVLDELETIPGRQMTFFVDDNLVGYGQQARKESLELFRGMVERRLDMPWICQASLNFAEDEELLHWASRAGCKMVLLGLEAEATEALTEMNKRLNLRLGVDAYEEVFRRIHRAGIVVLGAFVFGSDSDTPETMRRRADYIIRSRVDVVQATGLTPLPGTRLFDRLKQEGRLLRTDYPRDWDRYTMVDLVHRPLRMAPEVYVEAMREQTGRIYARSVIARKALRTLGDTRRHRAALLAWQSNQNYRRVAMAARRRYEHVRSKR